MAFKTTFGKATLGGGKKMEVEMHAYGRSTHDKSYIFRTTGSMGTLIPFMKQIMTPGSTLDINLACEILTLPTVGPAFASAKVQLDVISAPVRLYHAWMHNNKLNIGRDMSKVKLPTMTLFARGTEDSLPDIPNLDITQINPSSLLAYLGIMGVGHFVADGTLAERDFHALWLLLYADAYKNYYANKQEEEGAMIWAAPAGVDQVVFEIQINDGIIPQDGGGTTPITIGSIVEIAYDPTPGKIKDIIFMSSIGDLPAEQVLLPVNLANLLAPIYEWRWNLTGNITVTGWRYRRADEIPEARIQVSRFPLSTIDDMREEILAAAKSTTAFNVNAAAETIANNNPYLKILNWTGENSPYLSSQQGLFLKTYQSDLFNNWLNSEWIDDPITGVNARSSVSTVGNTFTMDALAMAEKVWEMLNRINTAGGAYKDWLDVMYTDNYYGGIETPVYHGSLIKELVFQEVVSNSESAGENGGVQPLGTLAGRGKLGGKHKGGKMVIKVNEHTLVMGIFSITPRIDYSQGNDWDTYSLLTMDDFHKPALDQIGFQELIEEQMAWWSTQKVGAGNWTQLSAGKQQSWTNYMTEVNRAKGNFAIVDNQMFMTFNRKYRAGGTGIDDMTTYIDPEKFNYIFAQTALDAQNYWIQIAVDLQYRGMMSAKQMPSL